MFCEKLGRKCGRIEKEEGRRKGSDEKKIKIEKRWWRKEEGMIEEKIKKRYEEKKRK